MAWRSVEDTALLQQTMPTAVEGVDMVSKFLSTSTDEVQNLLRNECDVIFECRFCRNFFRSIINFISHKRTFCRSLHQTILPSSSSIIADVGEVEDGSSPNERQKSRCSPNNDDETIEHHPSIFKGTHQTNRSTNKKIHPTTLRRTNIVGALNRRIETSSVQFNRNQRINLHTLPRVSKIAPITTFVNGTQVVKEIPGQLAIKEAVVSNRVVMVMPQDHTSRYREMLLRNRKEAPTNNFTTTRDVSTKELALMEYLTETVGHLVDIGSLTCQVDGCSSARTRRPFSHLQALAYHLSIKHPRRVLSGQSSFHCLLCQDNFDKYDVLCCHLSKKHHSVYTAHHHHRARCQSQRGEGSSIAMVSGRRKNRLSPIERSRSLSPCTETCTPSKEDEEDEEEEEELGGNLRVLLKKSNRSIKDVVEQDNEEDKVEDNEEKIEDPQATMGRQRRKRRGRPLWSAALRRQQTAKRSRSMATTMATMATTMVINKDDGEEMENDNCQEEEEEEDDDEEIDPTNQGTMNRAARNRRRPQWISDESYVTSNSLSRRARQRHADAVNNDAVNNDHQDESYVTSNSLSRRARQRHADAVNNDAVNNEHHRRSVTPTLDSTQQNNSSSPPTFISPPRGHSDDMTMTDSLLPVIPLTSPIKKRIHEDLMAYTPRARKLQINALKLFKSTSTQNKKHHNSLTGSRSPSKSPRRKFIADSTSQEIEALDGSCSTIPRYIAADSRRKQNLSALDNEEASNDVQIIKLANGRTPRPSNLSDLPVFLTEGQRDLFTRSLEPIGDTRKDSHKCVHCGIILPNVQEGRRHIVSHLRIIRLRCSLCDAGSFFCSDMRAHLQLRHCERFNTLPLAALTEDPDSALCMTVKQADDLTKLVDPPRPGRAMYSVGKIISGDFPAGKVPEKLNEARLIAISKVCSMYKGETKVGNMYKGELEKQQKKKKQENKTMETSTPLVDNTESQ